MSVDYRIINREMKDFDQHQHVWLFAYGSLLYKVDFPIMASRVASIRGWQRRFWQASHDHRGTPEAPGRVVTLVESAGAVCKGLALCITPEEFDLLDHREKNGYRRVAIDIVFEDDQTSVRGLIYIADAANPAFIGPESNSALAQRIASSHGPSGTNREYLLRLAAALRDLNESDPHVYELERLVLALEPSK